MIIQVVTVKVQPGKEAQFEALVKSILPMVRQETDTLEYVLHRSKEECGKYLFYEKYANQIAKNLHLENSYVKEMISACSNLASEEPAITLYEEISY